MKILLATLLLWIATIGAMWVAVRVYAPQHLQPSVRTK